VAAAAAAAVAAATRWLKSNTTGQLRLMQCCWKAPGDAGGILRGNCFELPPLLLLLLQVVAGMTNEDVMTEYSGLVGKVRTGIAQLHSADPDPRALR
jgi:hypothetical protein